MPAQQHEPPFLDRAIVGLKVIAYIYMSEFPLLELLTLSCCVTALVSKEDRN